MAFGDLRALSRKEAGPRHDRTVALGFELGRACADAGRAEEAIVELREALAGVKEVTGPGSPAALRVAERLALELRDAGRAVEAVAVLEEAVRNRFGPEGAPGAKDGSVISGLVAALAAAGRFADAEAMADRHLRLCRDAGDAGAAGVALLALGRCLTAAGRPEDAEPHLRETWDARRESDPEGWQTAAAASALGECLSALGRFEEAEGLLLDGHEGIVRGLSGINPYRPALRNAVLRLVRHFEARHVAEPGAGHDARAAEWRERLTSGPLRIAEGPMTSIH